MTTNLASIPALIWLDFGFLALVILLVVVTINRTIESNDKEIIKLRFASVTFTGIMIVFIFTAVLYASGSTGGDAIFDRAVTSMTPLAGVILGYMFGTKGDLRNNAAGQELPPEEKAKRPGG